MYGNVTWKAFYFSINALKIKAIVKFCKTQGVALWQFICQGDFYNSWIFYNLLMFTLNNKTVLAIWNMTLMYTELPPIGVSVTKSFLTILLFFNNIILLLIIVPIKQVASLACYFHEVCLN